MNCPEKHKFIKCIYQTMMLDIKRDDRNNNLFSKVDISKGSRKNS